MGRPTTNGWIFKAIVRESAVRFRHAVRVFALLDRVAAVVGCIHQFTRQAGGHGGFAAVTRCGDQPANGQGLRTLRTHFDGNLIGRTANAAAANFDARLDVVQRVMEHADRILLGAGLDGFQGAINDRFSNSLLAVLHDGVHEFRQNLIAIFGIGQDDALFGATTT